MRVYRIYRAERRDAAFSGEGAKITGARWNLPGTRVVYASSTVSLCLLELFVHVDPEIADISRLNLEYRWADIPDRSSTLEIPEKNLPNDWKEFPWPQSTQEIGTKWMNEAEHLVLSVPSVVVPIERNFLINPAHSEFSKIRIGLPSALDLVS